MSAFPNFLAVNDLCSLLLLIGVVLLLPGVCGIILAGLDPDEMLVDRYWTALIVGLVAIGAGGVALIWWALRRPKQ